VRTLLPLSLGEGRGEGLIGGSGILPRPCRVVLPRHVVQERRHRLIQRIPARKIEPRAPCALPLPQHRNQLGDDAEICCSLSRQGDRLIPGGGGIRPKSDSLLPLRPAVRLLRSQPQSFLVCRTGER
jgi:hypothetical protein